MKNIFSQLKTPILVVGIGNIMKGDDAAGPVLAENMRARNKKTLSMNCGEVPENYLSKIISSGAKTVVLADAVAMKGAPGDTRLFSCEEIEGTGVSTHGISLALLADTIKQGSGADIYLLGIQPKSVKLGEPLSKDVEKAVAELLEIME